MIDDGDIENAVWRAKMLELFMEWVVIADEKNIFNSISESEDERKTTCNIGLSVQGNETEECLCHSPPSLVNLLLPSATTEILQVSSIVINDDEGVYPQVPQFYFPQDEDAGKFHLEDITELFAGNFLGVSNPLLLEDMMVEWLPSVLGISKFFARPISMRIFAEYSTNGVVDQDSLLRFCHDYRLKKYLRNSAWNFFHLCTKSEYVYPENLFDFVRELIRSHRGLQFFRQATECHQKYIETVVYRIFYVVDKRRIGRFSLLELRRAKPSPVEEWLRLDNIEDINTSRSFFSYEHYYVMFTKFHELDTDSDSLLTVEDLSGYNEGAYAVKTIERLFSVASNMNKNHIGFDFLTRRMTYCGFVEFLMNDENPATIQSVQNYFQIVDLNSDGIIDSSDIKFFFEMQGNNKRKWDKEMMDDEDEWKGKREGEEVVVVDDDEDGHNHHLPSLEDVICQLTDLVLPRVPGRLDFLDFKKDLNASAIFFSVLLNRKKFHVFEYVNPFTLRLDLHHYHHHPDLHENPNNGLSTWDKYCQSEYNRIANSLAKIDNVIENELNDACNENCNWNCDVDSKY